MTHWRTRRRPLNPTAGAHGCRDDTNQTLENACEVTLIRQTRSGGRPPVSFNTLMKFCEMAPQSAARPESSPRGVKKAAGNKAAVWNRV
jgi:hypothetical protein